jgi:hypothetical protein
MRASAGVDTHEHDPISNFGLTTEGYRQIGKIISTIRKPTLFVLEGWVVFLPLIHLSCVLNANDRGYHLASIGLNIRNLLNGFQDGESRA